MFEISPFDLYSQPCSRHTQMLKSSTVQGGKNGHENFRQSDIYNFCAKFVIIARNRKATLTQQNMQYIPCNSALLGLPKKHCF